MDKRREEIMKLKAYTEEIDNELTMILQTLQWERKHLLQNPVLVQCRYDSNHKVPPDKTEEHEKECFLRKNGYSKDDQLLPEPLDSESNTLVKLRKEDIEKIIANASRTDNLFKKGCREAEPLSLGRLQVTYTADERRAIHDAVVSAVPSCHDLTDLALLCGGDEKSSQVILSRQEILLQLRNMRRRRTKYRVAAKSRNYSDVLRDVIRTQMEHYNDGKSVTDPKVTQDRDNDLREAYNDRRIIRPSPKDYRYDGKVVPNPIQIKIEKEDFTDKNRDYSRERSNRDKAYRYEMGNRDRRDRDNDRRECSDRSRERRNDNSIDRSQKYGEHSRKRRHDHEYRETRYDYDETEDRRKDNRDKEYRIDKTSKRSHRHKDYDPEHQVKKETGLDDESSYHHRHTSRESRHDENKDRARKHKKERHRDRERSKERRKDYRYEEGPSERILIKQEREDSAISDDMINCEREKRDSIRKSKHRRHEKSQRDDRNYDSHSLEVNQGKHVRYYDKPSEEIYDPNKKIKMEK